MSSLSEWEARRGLLDGRPPHPHPRSPVGSTVHSSLTCTLRGTPSPGLSFGKMTPGDLFLAFFPFAGGLLFIGETPVSSWRIPHQCISCSHRSKQYSWSRCCRLLGASLWTSP